MSESKPLSASQIIDHVVNHFSKNPRSMNADGHRCFYNGPDGEKCAFGLMCENSEELIEGFFADVLIQKNIASIKPEFSGHSIQFYLDIQKLHDRNYFWNKTSEGNELTPKGIDFVSYLKESYQ